MDMFGINQFLPPGFALTNDPGAVDNIPLGQQRAAEDNMGQSVGSIGGGVPPPPQSGFSAQSGVPPPPPMSSMGVSEPPKNNTVPPPPPPRFSNPSSGDSQIFPGMYSEIPPSYESGDSSVLAANQSSSLAGLYGNIIPGSDTAPGVQGQQQGGSQMQPQSQGQVQGQQMPTQYAPPPSSLSQISQQPTSTIQQLPALTIPAGGPQASYQDAQMPTSPSSPTNKLKHLPNFIDSYNNEHKGLFSFERATEDGNGGINPYKIYQYKQDSNIVPDSIFSMVSAIPDCEPTRAKSGLPSSVIVTPFIDNTPIIIDGDPERCARCRAYRCALCEVNKNGWTCAFCGRKNKENTTNKVVYNKAQSGMTNFLNAPSPQSAAEHSSVSAPASTVVPPKDDGKSPLEQASSALSFLPPGFDSNFNIPSTTEQSTTPQGTVSSPSKEGTGISNLPSVVDYATDSEDYIYRPPLNYGKTKDFVQPTAPLQIYQEEVGFSTKEPQAINPIVHVILVDMSLPSLRNGLAKATLSAVKTYLLMLQKGMKQDKHKRLMLVSIDGQYATYRQMGTGRKYLVHAGSMTQWSLDGSNDTIGTANLRGSQSLSAPQTGTPGVPLPMNELCPILSNEPFKRRNPGETKSSIDFTLEIVGDMEAECSERLTTSNQSAGATSNTVNTEQDSIYHATPGVSVAAYLLGICCSLRNIGGRITLSVAESVGSVCESTNLFFDVASICRACGVCVDCVCLKTERNVRGNETNNVFNNYACLLCPLCYRTGGRFFYDSIIPTIPSIIPSVPQVATNSFPLSVGILDKVLAFVTSCITSHVALNVTMTTRISSTLSMRKTCGMGTLATVSAFGKMIMGPGGASALSNSVDKKVLAVSDEENEGQADVISVPGVYPNVAYEVFYKSESPIPASTTKVTFQTAMLFTSSLDGRRHVRVITKSIPVVTKQIDLARQISQTALLYSSAIYAAQRVFEYVQEKHSASIATANAISEAVNKTSEDVTNYRLVYPLAVYKKAICVERGESTSSPSTILLLPECMQYAPGGYLGLLKRQLFLSNNLSYIAADAMRILSTPPLVLCRECYPALIDVSELVRMNDGWKKGDTPNVKLLRPCGALLPQFRTSAMLLWVGNEMSLYVGSEFDRTLLKSIFGVDSFPYLRSGTYYVASHTKESDLLLTTMSLLSSVPPVTIGYRCTVIPEGPLYPFFAKHLVEDKFNDANSFLEYLGTIQSRILSRIK